MIMSIYLHKYVVDVLKLFGKLDNVVNNILEYCDNRDGLTDYPRCPERGGAGRYNIDVTYNPYLEVYNKIGPTSPRTSIRRILYNFVDNELYTEDEWLSYNSTCNAIDNYDYVCHKCDDVYSLLKKMYDRITIDDNETRVSITKMMSDILSLKIKLLREDVKDEGKECTRQNNG